MPVCVFPLSMVEAVMALNHSSGCKMGSGLSALDADGVEAVT
jgi:hypothetical protein